MRKEAYVKNGKDSNLVVPRRLSQDDILGRMVHDYNFSMDLLDKLFKTHQRLKMLKSVKIEFATPIVTLNNEPIIYPHTINIIQGKKGQHKSRLSEYLLSAMLGSEDLDVIGLKKASNIKFKLCLIDTERNLKDQLPFAIQSILKKSGLSITDDPDNFFYTSLLDIDRENRFEALNKYLMLSTRTSEDEDVHTFIVLDVVTDMIANFNDPKESLKLIDMINKTINQTNSTFVCVIHENPSKNDFKARGHLGTELVNKASTVISVGFIKDKNDESTNVIEVKFLHNRMTERLKPVYLQYDNDVNGLIVVDPVELGLNTNQSNKKVETDQIEEKIKNYFSTVFQYKKTDLVKYLAKDFNVSTRTINDRLGEIDFDDFMLDDGKYKIIEEAGKKNTKFLKKVSLEE